MQDRPVDFNFDIIHEVQIVHCKQPLRNYNLSSFDVVAKNTQLTEKTIKIPLSFLSTYLCEARLSSYTLTKTTYDNLFNVEAVRGFSINSNIKEICRIVNQCHFSH